MKRNAESNAACPCDPKRRYADCCGPPHAGVPVADAEALMRSRYSAYVLGLADYLLATWHPSTRPASFDLGSDQPTWLGLSVREHRVTGVEQAEVEFVARFRSGGGRAQRLHERSRFVREEGRWLYVDGDVSSA